MSGDDDGERAERRRRIDSAAGGEVANEVVQQLVDDALGAEPEPRGLVGEQRAAQADALPQPDQPRVEVGVGRVVSPRV